MDNGESSYRRYLDGDESAFDEVVKIYHDNLVFFINGYIHNLEDAQDIAIDSLLQLVIHKHRYNFKTSLKTYLFTIGRNKALNYIKHNKVLDITDLSDLQCASDEYSGLEERIIEDDKQRNVHRALSMLSENYRTVLYLVYFESLSYEDTARVMKKSKKQVDNLLYKAKAELRKVIGRDGELII